VKTLEQIDFETIVNTFSPPNKQFRLPRIAFFGLYSYLSMSDQRHICKNLGFEYYEKFGFGTQNEDEAETLTNQLRTIIGGYTQLIVIGDVAPPPQFNFNKEFYKKLKNQNEPELFRHQIPIIFESEFVKIHPNYPKIDKTTSWINVVP
jgi:hypothetical protein